MLQPAAQHPRKALAVLMSIEHPGNDHAAGEEPVVTESPSSRQPHDVPPPGSEPQGNITVIAAIVAIIVIPLIVLVVLFL
jgi:hypothetical protein